MRRHISVETKRLILRLAVVNGYRYKKIKDITGVSIRTIDHLERLRTWHRRIGDVVYRRAVDGQPRLLNGLELSFLESCIEWQPDLLISRGLSL